MMKILKNNRGISLIELISVLALSAVLIFVSGMVISVYFRRYKELNDYIDLQTEAMKCLDTIRNGYALGEGEQFYGVVNSRKLELTGNSQIANQASGIKAYPPTASMIQGNDFIHFYLDRGVIKVRYAYNGMQSSSAKDLFPIRSQQGRMQVTKFAVSDANAGGSLLPLNAVATEELAILKVNLQARVLVRDAALPRNKVYKTVDFTTYMVRK